MSLSDIIKADFKQAMLAHDEMGKVTLNGLKSAIKYKQVAKGTGAELTDAEIEAVVAHEVKARNDAIAIYRQAGDSERVAKETAERDIIAKYLPKQLTPDELRAKLEEIVKQGDYTQSDFGKVMGEAKKQLGNSASGGDIARMVRELLAQ